MEAGKRSRNFTEREKIILIEVAKEFTSIIDNKKTDSSSVEAKKQAWIALTDKYNLASETGFRTEKQLHALYDNLKKKAKKSMNDDKLEMYRMGSGIFCPKTTAVVPSVFLKDNNIQVSENGIADKSQNRVVILEPNEKYVTNIHSTATQADCLENSSPSAYVQNIESMPTIKNMFLNKRKKKNINKLCASILKRKNQNLVNENTIKAKKIEILEIQRQYELMKLEKTKIILDLDIELKTTLLENAQNGLV